MLLLMTNVLILIVLLISSIFLITKGRVIWFSVTRQIAGCRSEKI